MLKEFIKKFSASFVLDLYLLKRNAEKRNDIIALTSLKESYPVIFIYEFDLLIASLIEIAEDLHACGVTLPNVTNESSNKLH